MKSFDKELENIIYTTIGRASMLWSTTPKGVFESSDARDLAENTITRIKRLLKSKKNR